MQLITVTSPVIIARSLPNRRMTIMRASTRTAISPGHPREPIHPQASFGRRTWLVAPVVEADRTILVPEAQLSTSRRAFVRKGKVQYLTTTKLLARRHCEPVPSLFLIN